jgi:hypothetical protein
MTAAALDLAIIGVWRAHVAGRMSWHRAARLDAWLRWIRETVR